LDSFKQPVLPIMRLPWYAALLLFMAVLCIIPVQDHHPVYNKSIFF